MSKPKKPTIRQPRDYMTLGMILNCKGGPHPLKKNKRRDQKERRSFLAEWGP